MYTIDDDAEFPWVDDEVVARALTPKAARVRMQLMLRPNSWALIEESTGVFAEQWWKKLGPNFEFQTTAVEAGAMSFSVYGRFVGDKRMENER